MTTEDEEDDRWTPVAQPGGIYCSPRCGGGCTREAFDAAAAAAEALAKRLGRGWKPHVWENLGWHYEAVKGESTVSDVHRSANIELAGCQFWYGGEDGESIEDLLGRAIHQTRTQLSRMEADLSALSKEDE